MTAGGARRHAHAVGRLRGAGGAGHRRRLGASAGASPRPCSRWARTSPPATSSRRPTRASSGCGSTSPTRPRSRRAFTEIEATIGPVESWSSTRASSSSSRWRRRRSRLAAHDARQPRRRLPVHPARAAGHEGARLRAHGHLGSSAGITRRDAHVAAYAASKAGLMAFTKAIANEYMRTASPPTRSPRADPHADDRRHRRPRRTRCRSAGSASPTTWRRDRLPRLRPRLLRHRRDPGRQRRLADRLMATMRAMELQAFGAPLVPVDRPVPEPGPGEVRVRVRPAASAAPTCSCRRAASRSPLPIVPGHEASGVVDALGDGVEGVAGRRAGRAVLHHDAPRRPLGGRGRAQPQPRRPAHGRRRRRRVRGVRAAPRHGADPPPAPPAGPSSAVLTDAVATPLHALRRVARCSPARPSPSRHRRHRLQRRAARPRVRRAVLAITRSPRKQELARELGAARRWRRRRLVARVRELTGGAGPTS